MRLPINLSNIVAQHCRVMRWPRSNIGSRIESLRYLGPGKLSAMLAGSSIRQKRPAPVVQRSWNKPASGVLPERGTMYKPFAGLACGVSISTPARVKEGAYAHLKHT